MRAENNKANHTFNFAKWKKKRKKDLTEQIHTINLEFTCDRLRNSTNRNPKETTEINQGLQRKGKCSIELTA